MRTAPIAKRDDILDRIVTKRRESIAASKRSLPMRDLKARLEDRGLPRGFKSAVGIKDTITVVAELKRGSPSKGIIREDFAPALLARCLQENGAAAISVLTEPNFFFGSPRFIGEVREESGLPLLRKDFIIDPYQVYESRVLGADAVLLIVRIVGPDALAELIGTAREAGLDALTEVHTEDELKTALLAGADLIAINNRDLTTFEVNLEVSMRLSALVPEGIPVIAASGIRDADDIKRLAAAGIRSFLVGETLMRIDDLSEMGRTLRELTGRTAGSSGGDAS